MSTATRRVRPSTRHALPAMPPRPEHNIAQAALVDYLASRAVTELVVVEFQRRSYRLEVALSWRGGRSVLTAARGNDRMFRSLDTLVTFLRTVGTGATVVRLELRP